MIIEYNIARTFVNDVVLTQNLVDESYQQAVGSSVSAVVRYMAFHGIPRWSFQWVLDNKTVNVSQQVCLLFKHCDFWL